MPDGLVGDPALRQRLADIGLGDAADVGRRQTLVDMLMRENDLRRLDRLAVFITHRHLALGVGAEALLLAGVARLGEQFVEGAHERRFQEAAGACSSTNSTA